MGQTGRPPLCGSVLGGQRVVEVVSQEKKKTVIWCFLVCEALASVLGSWGRFGILWFEDGSISNFLGGWFDREEARVVHLKEYWLWRLMSDSVHSDYGIFTEHSMRLNLTLLKCFITIISVWSFHSDMSSKTKNEASFSWSKSIVWPEFHIEKVECKATSITFLFSCLLFWPLGGSTTSFQHTC